MNVKLDSQVASRLLSPEPNLIKKEGWGRDNVVVLQVMLVGDLQVLMEVIYEEDLVNSEN